MTELLIDVQRRALDLSIRERAELARLLLESLDEDDPATVEELWVQEAENRWKEIEEGTTTLLDSDQVLAEARARLKRP